jgi:MarR family transcriptional regulator, lower aerobic nicotinate degradation pathway regulator
MQQLTADPGFLLSRVGAAVRAGFHEVLAGWGLRPLQYVILLVLEAGHGVSQQELCAATGIDSGNMVELLDGLEALEYAARARDPRDRRRHVVTITDGGRSALAELRPAIEAYNNGFLSPLTESERQQLTRTLSKLYATTTTPTPTTATTPTTANTAATANVTAATATANATAAADLPPPVQPLLPHT